MSDVVVFGTGDFAQVAVEYLREDSPHEVVALTVHERYIDAPEILGVPVVPFEGIESTNPPADCSMFVAVGFSRVNRARRELYEQCKAMGYDLISYVNSRATCSRDLELGENCFVFEQNVIQPFVTIGSDVIVWSGNHIGHHVVIGDHCFIASHAVISGRVTIGEETFVGVNATLRDGISVAPRCVIGAGTLVMKDTVEGAVYSARGTEPLERKSWELRGF